MRGKPTIYLTAWLLYVAFSFFLFPVLSLTVLLTSIPLTMLGGWLYRYPGAFATTLLTIPFHYFLLSLLSDDPKLTLEAFNPFGIGSQLFFSCSTVLLSTTHNRYIQLNDSLEELIEERTRDLQQLNNQLLEMEEQHSSDMLTSLLEAPFEHLTSMHRTSLLLTEHLETTEHPLAQQAQTIVSTIHACIKDLQLLKNAPWPTDHTSSNLEQSIQNFTRQFTHLTKANVECVSDGNWKTVENAKAHHLLHIVHEAVSNALRHGLATHIKIGMEQTADTSTLYIENNGNPMPASPESGMGLSLMHYRAAKIGATISIDSTPGENIRVQCTMPQSPEKTS